MHSFKALHATKAYTKNNKTYGINRAGAHHTAQHYNKRPTKAINIYVKHTHTKRLSSSPLAASDTGFALSPLRPRGITSKRSDLSKLKT